MDGHELDERLRAADPSRHTPTALSEVIDELFAHPATSRRRRRRRPLALVGGALVLTGGLAAGTDLGSYLLSVPPFSGLEYGADFRPADGLLFVPTEGQDRGERCRLYLDLGGLSDAQVSAVRDFWSSVDPAEFDIAVQERMENPRPDDVGYPESIESWAVVGETIALLDPIVPGIKWGAATPGESFGDGDPHLVAVTQLCRDDLDNPDLVG